MRLATLGSGAVGLALIWASAVGAQIRPGFIPEVEDVVEQGDRVRVTSDQTSGEFVVSGVGSAGLLLRAQPEIEVPIASLTVLQVHRGREISRLEGLFGGAFVGGLLGGALAFQNSQPHYRNLLGLSKTQSVGLGVGLGALVGLVVSRRSDEVWEEVALLHRLDERPRQVAAPAAATDPIIVVGDVGSNDLVELTVRNRSPDPIDAYAWWEGGARVSLGLVRANSTATFITAWRSSGIALVVTPQMTSDPRTLSFSSPAPPVSMARPSEFIVVAPDERLEWVVLESGAGVVRDYLRLTTR